MEPNKANRPEIKTRKDTMKEIQLTQGKVALVDDADFDWLNQWKWYARKEKHTFYAVRGQFTNGNLKIIRMHRLITGAPDGSIADHRDGNGLNNQRFNLRVCTPAENTRNRRITPNKTSGFKGVYWHRQDCKWVAKIKVNGKNISLGSFTDLQDAVKTYNEAAIKYHGDFACLNAL